MHCISNRSRDKRWWAWLRVPSFRRGIVDKCDLSHGNHLSYFELTYMSSRILRKVEHVYGLQRAGEERGDSIYRCHHILKLRMSHGRIIIIMRTHTPGKMVFKFKRGIGICSSAIERNIYIQCWLGSDSDKGILLDIYISISSEHVRLF